MPDDWLTQREAAAELHIHYKTLANGGMGTNVIPRIKLYGGKGGKARIFYARSAIESFKRDKESEARRAASVYQRIRLVKR
jgi:hypothetical protein